MLKTCPFCGKLPEIHQHYNEENMYWLDHHCDVIGYITIDWMPKEELIRIWNTRK